MAKGEWCDGGTFKSGHKYNWPMWMREQPRFPMTLARCPVCERRLKMRIVWDSDGDALYISPKHKVRKHKPKRKKDKGK